MSDDLKGIKNALLFLIKREMDKDIELEMEHYRGGSRWKSPESKSKSMGKSVDGVVKRYKSLIKDLE
jgi:hypothetical protein